MNQPPTALDLVFHDWMNLAPEERKQALEDIRKLADGYIYEKSFRRGRAINIVASFFHFLSEKPAP